jgi:raffinose/stachyose/melibiose transport system permease protein
MTRRLLGSVTQHALLILVSLAALYPVWFTLQTALKSTDQYARNPLGLPLRPTLHNLVSTLVDLPVPRWMLNSVIVTGSSVAIATVVALLASYAIVFGRFRGGELLHRSNLALMVIPPVVLLLPMFIFMVKVGLINTLPSVIVFYAGLLTPFSVFFLVNFFRTVPVELVEAATIDGASPLAILRRVVIPLSSGAVFTLAVVNAIYAWNELLVALVFLQDESQRTLMAGLALSQGRYSTNEPLVLAGAFVSLLPIVLLYLSGQRFIVRGFTAGIGR